MALLSSEEKLSLHDESGSISFAASQKHPRTTTSPSPEEKSLNRDIRDHNTPSAHQKIPSTIAPSSPKKRCRNRDKPHDTVAAANVDHSKHGTATTLTTFSQTPHPHDKVVDSGTP